MLPWITVDETRIADGTVLTLARRGTEWEVCANGLVLMSSRAHGSEDDLARLAFAKAKHARTVLIGGLGLGFSLQDRTHVSIFLPEAHGRYLRLRLFDALMVEDVQVFRPAP